jgi:hypothetical protein
MVWLYMCGRAQTDFFLLISCLVPREYAITASIKCHWRRTLAYETSELWKQVARVPASRPLDRKFANDVVVELRQAFAVRGLCSTRAS